MKTYEGMKPSNVLWLGSIPEHWTMRRNITLLTERDERSEKGEEQLLSLSQYTGITIRGKNSTKMGMHEAESLVGYKIVHENDIVMNIMLAWNGSTAKSKFEGIISPAYAVYHLIDDSANPDYLHYLYKTPYFMQYFEAYSTGLIKSRLRLYPQSFLHLSSIVPPCEEQDQIVRFLDWKVSEINRLINIKRKEIERLEELKQSRLLTIVTQGLNENVEMVDSGISHIGLVPKHWKVLLNHRVFKENCRPFSGEETVLSLSQKDGLLPYVDMKERSLHTASYENWKLVMPNDLVLNRFKAHLGVFFSSNYRGIVTFHYGVYEPTLKVASKYYEVLYHTPKFKQVFAGASNGMTVGLQNLSNTNFYKVYTVYPPYEEQCAIVDEVKKIEEEMQALILTVSKEIEMLHEFKTRLISDVVTGKIDVRGIEIPEYEYTAEESDTDSEAEGEEIEEEEGDD